MFKKSPESQLHKVVKVEAIFEAILSAKEAINLLNFKALATFTGNADYHALVCLKEDFCQRAMGSP